MNHLVGKATEEAILHLGRTRVAHDDKDQKNVVFKMSFKVLNSRNQDVLQAFLNQILNTDDIKQQQQFE